MKAGFLRAASAAALSAFIASAAGAGSVTPLIFMPLGVAMERSTIVPVADQSEAPIDINSASEDALRALPGVGPARAQAIASGRPYKGKDDLVKKNILPKNVYDGIKDRIVARQK